MTRRKHALVQDRRGSLRGDSEETIFDYAKATPEMLADYLLDEGGLAHFVDAQIRGLPRESWPWAEISRSLWALSGKKWLMRPETIECIYDQQILARGTSEIAA